MAQQSPSPALADLLSKRLVMVTGKGGIGKTLISSALALEARKLGKKVCLVESSAHDQLAPLFGHAPVGHQLREVLPGLSVINLNPQDNFRDFVIKHLGFAKLFEKVFTKQIVRSFIQMLPGIAELTLLGRLYYFVELDKEDRFDIVIFDGFASGHFHSLLKTPDAVLQSGMVGPVIAETERVRDFLTKSDKVAVALVTVPEELVVSEALDFAQKLKNDSPAKLKAVLANRCWPGAPEDASLTGASAEVLKYWQEQAHAQEQSLGRLQEGLKVKAGSLPVLALSERGSFAEPLKPEELTDWIEGARQL